VLGCYLLELNMGEAHRVRRFFRRGLVHCEGAYLLQFLQDLLSDKKKAFFFTRCGRNWGLGDLKRKIGTNSLPNPHGCGPSCQLVNNFQTERREGLPLYRCLTMIFVNGGYWLAKDGCCLLDEFFL